MTTSLVVLAAGIGSRYGGLKQIDPVGPSGEVILDYSVYDALRAGFDHVVFVIRPDIEADFKASVGARIEAHARVTYVHQRLDALPEGFTVPADRVKPWGTGQAVLTAAKAVDGPFAVINADDFYGRASYEQLYRFLTQDSGPAAYAMVGFLLRNTVSDVGHVARGICSASADGLLQGVEEYTHIEKTGAGIVSRNGDEQLHPLDGNALVSMNMWGFTPSLFDHLSARFANFLRHRGEDPKAEFFMPTVINDLIAAGETAVSVLETPSQWAGVTYPEEKDRVSEQIRALVRDGQYPESLWQAPAQR